MKRDVGLIGGIVALLFLFGVAHATTWYVHPDSTLNTIQAGLDSCADNDTVLVAPGIYYENLIWPNMDGINLISEFGPDTTIIDGDSSGRVIEVTTGVDSITIIQGFTIRNGYVDVYSVGGGIYALNSSPIVTNNIIANNIAGIGGGVACVSNSSPIIANNTIIGNTASFDLSRGGGGVYCCSSSAIITDNTIVGNDVGWCSVGGGISCWYSSPTISGNNIYSNFAQFGGGINCTYSSPLIDSGAIANNNGDGVYCEYESNPVINYNHITDNTGYGVRNVDSTVIIDGQHNWWGDPSGPGGVGPGMGDEVSEWVDYDPWLLSGPSGVVALDRMPLRFKQFGATIINGPLQLPKDKKCKVFDIMGRVVEPTKITRGIYFIEIDGVVTQKVVKVR